MRFIGGPVDGGRIRLDRQYDYYYIPIRPQPMTKQFQPAPGDAVPEVIMLLCYVYVRRGDCLIYTGEQLR